MNVNRGWATSELSLAALCGYGIFDLANTSAISIQDAALRAFACVSLAWIAGKYAQVRADLKISAKPRPTAPENTSPQTGDPNALA